MALRLPQVAGILAGGVQAGAKAFDEEGERQRLASERRAKALLAQVDAMTAGRQGEQALAMLPALGREQERATGIRPPAPNVVGTPTPDGGRDFNQMPTLNAMRATSGLAPLKPPPLIEVSPGASLVDQATGRVSFQAPFRPDSGLSFDQRRQLDQEQRDFKAQQAELDRNARRGAGGAGGGRDDQRSLGALESWRKRREAEPTKLLNDWIRLNTSTIPGRGRGAARTVPPMPAAIEAQRQLIQTEWEQRNPSPPTPGSQGRPDPFANP